MKKLMKLMTTLILFAVIGASAYAAAPAAKKEPVAKLAIQLGAPFCDNMILQRDMEDPVWGWSKPGTEVTVEFAGQKSTAKADKIGKWTAELSSLKASFEPREMVITENPGKKVVIKNILVGEVWMASGQSNMQMTCGKTTCTKLKVEPVGEGKVNPVREFQVTSVRRSCIPSRRRPAPGAKGPAARLLMPLPTSSMAN
jgi:hypothetical protein